MTHPENLKIQDPISEEFRIQTFQGMCGLEEVADDWKAITDSNESKEYFHLIDWYRCYLENLVDNPADSLFFIVYKNEKPIALFPFIRFTQNVFLIKNHVLGIPKHPNIPFGDFVIREDADLLSCMKILLNELNSQNQFKWDSIYLPRVAEYSLIFKLCKSFSIPGLFVMSHRSEPCDYLPVKPYDDLFQELSSKMRSNLRRARKKAEKLDDLHYCNVTTFPELEKAFDEFLLLEAASWKGIKDRGTAIQLDHQLLAFYRSLIKHFSKNKNCSIHILRDGDRPVCAAIGLITSKTYYGLKIAYDEEFKNLSPGNLLHEYILKAYAEEGSIQKLDFASNTAWQKNWSPLQYETFELNFFKRSIRGVLLVTLHKTRNYLRILKRKFREKYFVNKHGKYRLRFFNNNTSGHQP